MLISYSNEGVEILGNYIAEIGLRVRDVANAERISESAIVDVALRHLLASVAPEQLRPFLRQHGATMRRRF